MENLQEDVSGCPAKSAKCDDFPQDTCLLAQIPENARTWQVVRNGDHYYIHTGIRVNALNRMLYLETSEDITEIFEERTMGFSVYRRVTLAMLLCMDAKLAAKILCDGQGADAIDACAAEYEPEKWPKGIMLIVPGR